MRLLYRPLQPHTAPAHRAGRLISPRLNRNTSDSLVAQRRPPFGSGPPLLPWVSYLVALAQFTAIRAPLGVLCTSGDSSVRNQEVRCSAGADTWLHRDGGITRAWHRHGEPDFTEHPLRRRHSQRTWAALKCRLRVRLPGSNVRRCW